MKFNFMRIIQVRFSKIHIVLLLSVLISSFVSNVVAGQGDPGEDFTVVNAGSSPLTPFIEAGDVHGYPDKLNKAIPIIPDYSLTIGKSGSGTGIVTGQEIECGTTCYGLFPQGAVIELTAAPDTGSSFAGWSGGGCTGMGSCLITMNATTEVTAIFKRVFTISLIANNHGKIAPIDPVLVGLATNGAANVSMFSVDSGASQTVRIIPNPGCHVSVIRVDGVPVDIADTYTFHDIAADRTITIDFVPDSLSVADADDGNGGDSR